MVKRARGWLRQAGFRQAGFRQTGFTYLTVMFIIAILLGGLAIVGETWETSARREKEAELLFIGNQYRRAIGLYYLATPGPNKMYPRQIEDLLKDPRQPGTMRHLRKLFPDPMTGKEFVVIKGADGGVQGVASSSDVAPLKVAGFRVRDAIFESAQKYSEWKFIHTPPTAAAAAKPAAGAAATGAAGAKPTDPIQSPGAAAPNPPGGPMQGAKPPATGLEGTKH
jgi:type II secretory pathway pseudopilin PulG